MKTRAFAVAGLALGLVLSCGGSDDTLGNGTGAGGAGSGGIQFGKGGSGGVLSLDGGLTGGAAGSTIDPDAACATQTVGSSLQQLAMYVILDRSESMEQNNKRVNAAAAFSQFVANPSAAGIKVALNFFPNNGASCDGTGYDNPVVAMAALPGNAGAINNALATVQAIQGTPIEGALRGIQKYCTSYAQQNTSEKVVGVLITDGEPSKCEEGTAALAAIAGAIYAGSPAIPVFAIGMQGASFELLNQIAAAAGTSQSFDVSQGGAESFLNALLSIAGQALPCEFAVPTAQTGTVDPTKVNVKYTGASGEQYLGQVADAASCVANGWYYNDASAPTKIILCPDTCTQVRQGASGQVSIVLGCQTIAPPPPK